jgi:hypothetical protein
MDMAVLVLIWIGLGCGGMMWLTKARPRHADAIFLVGLLIYFGVPLMLVGLAGAR